MTFSLPSEDGKQAEKGLHHCTILYCLNRLIENVQLLAAAQAKDFSLGLAQPGQAVAPAVALGLQEPGFAA